MTGGVSQRRLSALPLAFRQVRYQNRLLLRSPSGPFFTFVIPLMVLLALNLVYGNNTIPTRGGIRFPRFYTPAMAAFAITNACYVNLLTGVTLSRDEGMLKRIRGTPLPPWAYLVGRAASAASLACLSAAAVLALGTVMYPVAFPWQHLPDLVLAAVVGIVCFSALGLAVTCLVPAADAALPIAYGTLLPLSFISDVFFPADTSPRWLRSLGSVLPLRPLARSLEAPFMPAGHGAGLHWAELAVMAGWTTISVIVIVRFFRWERPIRQHPLRRRLRPDPPWFQETKKASTSLRLSHGMIEVCRAAWRGGKGPSRGPMSPWATGRVAAGRDG